MALLTIANAKTVKGEDLGYLTGILYMAPSTFVKGLNVCKFASEGCKKACLFSAGRGVMRPVIQARVRRSELFRDDQLAFFEQLNHEIRQLRDKAKRKGMKLAIRLNGTSDISWENIIVPMFKDKNIFQLYPEIQFYDYTKNFTRVKNNKLNNYHLTLSRSETNEAKVLPLVSKSNVAIVFKDVPSTYKGFKVINGDSHDLRFLDEKGVIVGLTAKGKAKKDLSGFVV